jgi:hypothetical protein
MTIELPQLSDGAIEFAHQLELYSRENRPYSKDIHPATKALLVHLRIITGVKQGLDRTATVIEDTDGEDNISPNDDGNLMKANIWYPSNSIHN